MVELDGTDSVSQKSSNWQIYKWCINGINCQLGDNNISPTTQKREHKGTPETAIDHFPGCPSAFPWLEPQERLPPKMRPEDAAKVMAQKAEVSAPFVFWKAWVVLVGQFSGWWFQIFFIFIHTWGRFPFWLIFFKGVETTNQFCLEFKGVLKGYVFQET